MKVFLPIIMTATACSSGLERRERHEDIYIFHGQTTDLERLRDSVGNGWTGGKLIDYDVKARTSRYWAYSTRTASEARYVLMPAALAGLEVKIEEYDQVRWYPTERAKLDNIARDCGEKEDPYFLTPIREISISFPKGAKALLQKCLWDGASKIGIPVFDAKVIVD